MLSWLRRRRKTAERIDAEADALIDELGVEAYAEARRREYESSNDAMALQWNQVALAVAHKTGERIGLDTSSPMAMNTVFAPDREHAGDRKPDIRRQMLREDKVPGLRKRRGSVGRARPSGRTLAFSGQRPAAVSGEDKGARIVL